jgi:hypothetical protein
MEIIGLFNGIDLFENGTHCILNRFLIRYEAVKVIILFFDNILNILCWDLCQKYFSKIIEIHSELGNEFAKIHSLLSQKNNQIERQKQAFILQIIKGEASLECFDIQMNIY